MLKHARARPCLVAFIFLISFTLSFLAFRSSFSQSQADVLEHTVSAQALSQCSAIAFPGPGEGSVEVVVDDDHPGSWPIQVFKTISLLPPVMRVNHVGAHSKSGFIFMNQKNNDPGVHESYRFGLYIFTDQGELVWADDVPWSRGLSVQTYKGQQVLTYWSSAKTAAKGISWGGITILDSTYTPVMNICPLLGLQHRPGFEDAACEADLHEGVFTEEGTILVTAYNQEEADLSSVGGPENGWLYDCLAFELDPVTSEAIWRWSAREHVPLQASRAADFRSHPTRGTYNNAWDWFHLNSIQKINGNYLLNSRNTFQTYYVAPDGDRLWTLDGETGGSFGPLSNDTYIAFAHTARIVSTTSHSQTLTLFNNANGNGRPRTHPSQGLMLELPLPPSSSTIRVLQRFADPMTPLYSVAQGNVQQVSNGQRYMVGYGYVPVAQEWAIDEHDPEAPAKLVWEARYGRDGDQRQYRVERHKWEGTPKEDPVVVVEAAGTGDCEYWHAYVSWNGATDVSDWEVMAGEKAVGRMGKMGRVKKRGFETRFDVPKGVGCVRIGAVIDGKVARRSELVCSL